MGGPLSTAGNKKADQEVRPTTGWRSSSFCAKMRAFWRKLRCGLPHRQALSCCRGGRWDRRDLMASTGFSLSNSWRPSSFSMPPLGFATRGRSGNSSHGFLGRPRWAWRSKGSGCFGSPADRRGRPTEARTWRSKTRRRSSRWAPIGSSAIRFTRLCWGSRGARV